MARSDQRLSSSARRQPPGKRVNVAAIAIGAVLVMVVLLALFRSSEEPETAPGPEPGDRRPAATSSSPAPTPSPDFSFAADTPTPAATPTPSPPQPGEACVALSWNAELQPGSESEVVVAVTLENQCPHDLAGLSLGFEVSGYRDGELLRSAQGSFSGGLSQGQSTVLSIRLPGTPGGYDNVDLQTVSGAGG